MSRPVTSLCPAHTGEGVAKKRGEGMEFAYSRAERTFNMARTIKLTGRELGVMRCVGFGIGVTGAEIRERTHIEPEDLLDILNSMLDMGYIETATMKERVTLGEYEHETYEINPAYSSELKVAMRR
jgi:hypothetical protein